MNNMIIWSTLPFQERIKEYVKRKMSTLATNSKKYSIRDHYREKYEFKNDYQNRTNLVKKENCRIVICLQIPAAFLIRGRTTSFLLSLYRACNVRQKYMQSNCYYVIIPTARLKLLSSDQILTQIAQAGGGTLRPEIHKPINTLWSMEDLLRQWKESITAPLQKGQ
jgi:hypothetical protein